MAVATLWMALQSFGLASCRTTGFSAGEMESPAECRLGKKRLRELTPADAL